MGRFYGTVGYAVTIDKGHGVWEEVITEKHYYGDWLRLYSRHDNSGNINDNLTFGNRISIVADSFAFENFSHIRYVNILGAKWKVTEAEPQRPRIILTLGGEYNE